MYKAEFTQNLFKVGDNFIAKTFNFTYAYIDIVIFLEYLFEQLTLNVLPIELLVKLFYKLYFVYAYFRIDRNI